MKQKYFLILIIIILSIGGLKGQDPHFSQYYANPLYLNPALAGSQICPRLAFNFRSQWPSITGTYVTYNASYDMYVPALSGGIGVLVDVDRAGEGVLNTTLAGLMYAFRLKVSDKFYINTALQATFVQKTLDWEKLIFPDQIDPRWGIIRNTNEIPPENLTKNFADFTAGIAGYGERFFVGFSASHITRPNEGFISTSRLPVKYTVHAGGVISIESKPYKKYTVEETTLSPNILFSKQQDFEEFNYGLYLNKYPFVVGTWFRHSTKNPDAFIVLLGFVQETFQVGYSYDITVSRLTNQSGGAHEFSLTFRLPCPVKAERIAPINCPKF